MCARGLFFLLFAIVLVSTETKPTEIIRRDLTNVYFSGNPNLTLHFSTPMFTGFRLEVKGILKVPHDQFVAYMPMTSSDGREFCKIVYSYEKDYIEVFSPPSSPKVEPQGMEYFFKPKPEEINRFILKIKAKVAQVPKFFFDFEANKHDHTGPTGYLDCYVNYISDFNKLILSEGVESVQSILFTYDSF